MLRQRCSLNGTFAGAKLDPAIELRWAWSPITTRSCSTCHSAVWDGNFGGGTFVMKREEERTVCLVFPPKHVSILFFLCMILGGENWIRSKWASGLCIQLVSQKETALREENYIFHFGICDWRFRLKCQISIGKKSPKNHQKSHTKVVSSSKILSEGKKPPNLLVFLRVIKILVLKKIFEKWFPEEGSVVKIFLVSGAKIIYGNKFLRILIPRFLWHIITHFVMRNFEIRKGSVGSEKSQNKKMFWNTCLETIFVEQFF